MAPHTAPAFRSIVARRLSLAAALLATSSAAAQPVPATLPGGASALTEVHGDWTVGCQVQGERKHCLVTQQVLDGNRQRLVAMELAPAQSGATGNLALPFGLLLASGASLTIDDARPVSLTFRTCLPAGCVVPLTLDAPTLERLKKATTLKITATTADNSSPASFSISPKGLAGAYVRAQDLAGTAGQARPPNR
jgi:invasion protein IalB